MGFIAMTERRGRVLSFWAFHGALSAILLGWSLMRGVPVSVGLLAYCASLPVVATWWGQGALWCAGMKSIVQCLGRDGAWLLQFALGICLLNLVLMAMAFLLPFGIIAHFAVLCVAAIVWAAMPKRHDDTEGGSVGPALLAVAFAFGAITIILYYPLKLNAIGPEVVTFSAYKDIFLHAKTLAMFSDSPVPFSQRSIVGAPMSLYHYASYLLAALYRACTGTNSLDAITGMWTPLGFLTLAASAYAVGRYAGHIAGAFLALAALLILPDGSLLPTSQSHLSFFTYTRISPSMAYAIAQAILALYVCSYGVRERSSGVVVLAFVLALGTVAVKAQVAVFVIPVVIAYVLFTWPGLGMGTRLGIFAVLAVLGLASLQAAFRAVPWLGALGESGFSDYMAYLFKTSRPYDPLFRAVREMEGETTRNLIGLALTPVATFGVLLPWYGALLVVAWRRKCLHLLDLLPAIFVVLYLATMVVWPITTRAPFFEFQHRPHVFFYAVMAVYCGAKTGALLPRRAFPVPKSLAYGGGGLVLALLLFVPWFTKDHYQYNCHATRLRGTYEIPRGLWDTAVHIREHAQPGDVFADSQSDPWGFATGIADIQALRSRIAMISNPEGWKAALDRTAAIQRALETANTVEGLRAVAREHGVRWYLHHPEGPALAWPDGLRKTPAFASQGYAVYNLYALEAPL